MWRNDFCKFTKYKLFCMKKTQPIQQCSKKSLFFIDKQLCHVYNNYIVRSIEERRFMFVAVVEGDNCLRLFFIRAARMNDGGETWEYQIFLVPTYLIWRL